MEREQLCRVDGQQRLPSNALLTSNFEHHDMRKLIADFQLRFLHIFADYLIKPILSVSTICISAYEWEEKDRTSDNEDGRRCELNITSSSSWMETLESWCFANSKPFAPSEPQINYWMALLLPSYHLPSEKNKLRTISKRYTSDPSICSFTIWGKEGY